MCTLSRHELSATRLTKIEEWEGARGVRILEVFEDEEGGIFPTLINGRPVDRAQWLHVVRIGQRSCSATAVGPNAVVTAAHCGRHNSLTNVEFYNGPNIRGRVRHHPKYRNSGSNYDIAVIVLDGPVEMEGLSYARVGLDHVFQNGQDVDIAGYGCTRPGGGGGNDGVLRWGESRVIGTTPGTDVITRHRPTGAALCFGDSGGPMFADKSDQTQEDTLIAVNSKGNIRDTNYNCMIQPPAISDWLREVAEDFELQMNGVNWEANPDRPDPPDPPGGGQLATLIAQEKAELAEHEQKWASIYANCNCNDSGGQSGGPVNPPPGEDWDPRTFD